MIWFQWVLIGILSVSIIFRLIRLGGYKPEPPGHVIIGMGLLVDALLIIGIIIWL